MFEGVLARMLDGLSLELAGSPPRRRRRAGKEHRRRAGVAALGSSRSPPRGAGRRK
jgi:hypothetical protein